MQFTVFHCDAEIPPEYHAVMDKIVDPAQKHKNNNYPVEIQVLILADGIVLGGKSAGCQCAECMAERIEQRHTPNKQ